MIAGCKLLELFLRKKKNYLRTISLVTICAIEQRMSGNRFLLHFNINRCSIRVRNPCRYQILNIHDFHRETVLKNHKKFFLFVSTGSTCIGKKNKRTGWIFLFSLAFRFIKLIFPQYVLLIKKEKKNLKTVAELAKKNFFH